MIRFLLDHARSLVARWAATLLEHLELGEDADDEGEHYPHGWMR